VRGKFISWLVLIYAAVLTVWVAYPYLAASVSGQWRTLGSIGQLYSDEVMFSGIAPPDIKSATGRAKLVPDMRKPSIFHLGYGIQVEMAPLDLKTVPEKYRKDQVYYEVNFEFQLLDKDGFVLTAVTGPPEELISGRLSKFQSLVGADIPEYIAASVRSVTASISVSKCLSCS
jgi:hypothetical protein